MAWTRKAASLVAAALITSGLAALGASSARAATTQLCQMQTTPVASGVYNVQNNEWGSGASECATTDGNAGFTTCCSAAPTPPLLRADATRV